MNTKVGSSVVDPSENDKRVGKKGPEENDFHNRCGHEMEESSPKNFSAIATVKIHPKSYIENIVTCTGHGDGEESSMENFSAVVTVKVHPKSCIENIVSTKENKTQIDLTNDSKSKTQKNEVGDLTEMLNGLKICDKTHLARRSRRKTAGELVQEQMEEVRALLRKDCDGIGLQIELFPDKGRGVITTKDRKKGEFVVELAGDLIDVESANQRENDSEMYVSKGSYMLYFKHRGRQYCIDATAETGRMGRLLNHSRKHPNLVTKVVEVDEIPRVYMVAKDDIKAGTELVFDYGDRNKEAIKDHPWLED